MAGELGGRIRRRKGKEVGDQVLVVLLCQGRTRAKRIQELDLIASLVETLRYNLGLCHCHLVIVDGAIIVTYLYNGNSDSVTVKALAHTEPQLVCTGIPP